ncbi:MAG TPA: asparagine synthase-related protein, partial [Devosiaceae bacterium]|nr:asparagine synthase-related protein [Devosiaceae bacterium]
LAGDIWNIGEVPVAGPAPGSAAELILRIFERGDEAALAAINGQYCAALYDASRHRLILVTDRHASFPVHVWADGGEVRFATQIHTLLGDGAVPRRADSDGLAQIFSLFRTMGATTNIAGVRAVGGAGIWQIGDKAPSERSYWQLRWRAPQGNRRDAAVRLAEALQSAVARQGMANGAKANGGGATLLLSGGVDSRLVLAAGGAHPPTCWTTASFEGARELDVARGVSGLFDAPHRTALIAPGDTLDRHDDAVVESSGLYPASTPIAAFMPEVARNAKLAFTGHGLDYTVRGMYLPYQRVQFGRSAMRLPRLMPLPARPDGAFVLRNLRHGPAIDSVDRFIRPAARRGWWARIEATLDTELEPWLSSDCPANAWDALIVRAVCKHYTFTGMMAVRACMDLAIPAFDNEVVETYLSMPPAWRVERRVAQMALARLSPEAAAYPNANTGRRADLRPWVETAVVLADAAKRRLGIGRMARLPSAAHSHGSWQNTPALYREDPGYRQRFAEIRGRVDGLGFGQLDGDALAGAIDSHLDGSADHTKILRALLSHDAWMRHFGIEAHA